MRLTVHIEEDINIFDSAKHKISLPFTLIDSQVNNFPAGEYEPSFHRPTIVQRLVA